MSAVAPPSGHAQFTVSVVIPAYNYARFLAQAVDSALAQTYPPLEILIVDDGSTDDTAKLVAGRYRDSTRVRYIHQNNAGLSAARNTGVQNARGELVAFLDADDYWMPDFLKEIVARFASLPREYVLVASRAQWVDENGVPVRRSHFRTFSDRELTAADLLMKTRFSPSTAVVRRHIFAELGGFDTKLRSSEDRDMWIRIAACHRVYYCGQRLINVRRHSTSMSTHTDRMKVNTGRTFEKARSNPHLARLPRALWRRVYAFSRFETAWMYFEEGRRWAAVRDLIASVLYWPWLSRPDDLNEPVFFRLRSFKHFLLAATPHRKP